MAQETAAQEMPAGGMAAGEELNVPIGDMLRSIAVGIAEAQAALDRSSMEVAEMMSGRRMLRDHATGLPVDAAGETTAKPMWIDSRVYFGHTRTAKGNVVPQKASMIELGFVPTFYQFVDTVIEIKLTMSMSKSASGELEAKATTVDAAYASSYNFSAEMTSVVKTKLVPVPPPAILDDRIRALLEEPGVEGEESAASQRAETPPQNPASIL